jgi:RecB family exonuclease
LGIGDWGLEIGDWRPFQPEQVEMVYWFANFPQDPERFPYDAAQYEADNHYLASLIEEIKGLGDGDFPLTTQERRCRYCPYRSLCRRGIRAGAFDEAEDEPEWGNDFEIAFEFEQIAEIEY